MSVTLSSWKEIAAYLGKGVRTVQRWEQQFALPVRRPNAKSHVIFAIPEELDAWIKRQEKNGPTPTSPGSTKINRAQQDKLVKQLEDRVSRLHANRRVLSLELTRLMAQLNQIADRNHTADRENGRRRGEKANSPRVERGAA